MYYNGYRYTASSPLKNGFAPIASMPSTPAALRGRAYPLAVTRRSGFLRLTKLIRPQALRLLRRPCGGAVDWALS
jgi:hypothetical protein